MAAARNKFTWILFIGAVFLFENCLKPTSVIRQDQAPDKTQAKAATLFKEAEGQFQQDHLKQALQQYQTIARQYFNTTSADNALLRIAQIQKREKNFPAAENTLKKLVTSYPESDVRPQALRELVAITMQQSRYTDALTYLIDIDLKKLSAKDQSSLNVAANQCIQKANRPDLEFLWIINWTDVDASPALSTKIIGQISTMNDKKLLETIIQKRKNQFPALEAAVRRYKISKDAGDSDSKKWAAYVVEHFPTSSAAQFLRVEISEPIQVSSNGVYNIGALLPLSGEQKDYGNQVLNGIKTAMELLKQTNPQSNIQLYVEDIGQGGNVVKSALQKLLLEKQVIAVIGPLSAKDTEAAAELAQVNNLPLISLSPAENITNFGSTVFRNSLSKNEQAVALSQLLTDVLKIQRIAILYPNNSYGKEFMEVFWLEFEKRGGKIRGVEEYDRATSDYETSVKKLVGLWRKDVRKNEICSKLKANQWAEMDKNSSNLPQCFPMDELPPILDFEAIFVPDSPDKARQILPTLLFHGVKGVQVIGTNLWNTNELLTGSIGNEMEGAIFLDGFNRNKNAPFVTSFMQKFYELNGAEPGILEAQGFDSAMAILQILQKKSPGTREAFTKYLTRLSDFKGVTGLTGFSGNREAEKTVTPFIVDQGKIVELR